MAEEPRTMVFYESPHRIIKCLEQLKEACGSERLISVSRELTKIFEETQSGTIQEVLDYFLHATVKGEFVVVLEGKKDFEKRESSGD
jgi:16S rRNA (cytidine1402-2'-O)-methyltransferase